ncbi:MAG: NADH-quinone oxidoreductase subunit L [Propionibacteriaceae bacterium]|jgi:NADH-quinone oxidoreductase subunit L|nr:NADH-quinone oxidoreductase subunit L [Propionibacteriaceae bacterium]
MLETLTPIAATGIFQYAWLIIAIPAVVAALLLILGRVTNGFGHWIATLAPIASFVIALVAFVQLLGLPSQSRAVVDPLYTWFASGTWQIDVALLIDPLSILFVLLITGVGSIIHIYSIGYMADDPNRRRFFAYLNLFIAAMLILVLADNYLVLFVGWEGVGLASYLLISFWAERPSAAAAGKKAFVMNRVGDLGLLAAVFTMLAMFGSSSFAAVDAGASQLSLGWATFVGFMLLLAACGKSAQVPLQAWLLDAMEGPTPVSALIHAATMVTAGVYLVVRSGAIFEHTPAAQLGVAIVGTVTLLVGAWIGCSKDDIKKVLAGSTMSQIGYMMLAAGIGPAGYAFAIFHLLTHGFFKANMFLGAGSVMHGTGDDVNMRHFGALRKAMPITFVTFGIGYLAIIGFPFFSGFYSKDHIIEAAFHAQPALGVLALIGAGVTAFYMTRLMLMTFFGDARWVKGVHPHESPAVMWVPLVLLAIGSFIGGMVLNGWIGAWLAPIGAEAGEHASWLPEITWLGVVTLLVVAAGVALGWFVFGRRPVPAVAPDKVSIITTIGRHDLYGDQIIDHGVVQPGLALGRGVALADELGVDPATDGLGWVVQATGNQVRRLQNGYVRTYGVTMAIGVVLIGLALVVSRLV